MEIQAHLPIFGLYGIALKALYMTTASSLCRTARGQHRRHSTIFPKAKTVPKIRANCGQRVNEKWLIVKHKKPSFLTTNKPIT